MVGACCKADELAVAVEISDGQFLASSSEYEELAADLAILMNDLWSASGTPFSFSK